MPLGGALTGGAIAAPIIGGLIGADQARKERAAAQRAMQRALEQYENIELPGLEEQLYDLYLPEFLGEYQPGMEEFLELGPSAYEDVETAPELRQAQMEALQELAEIGETGLTEGERAALREVRRGAAAQAEAQRGAVMQEMARRGMAGSGQELAAQLSSAQSAADRASREGGELAQMAQVRALEAIAQRGQLGGEIRGQEFEEQARAAEAADLIARMNQRQQQAVQRRNVEARRQAQLRNLQERQRLAEERTRLQNIEEQRRATLPGEQFQREMQLAGGRAGAYGTQAEQSQRAAGERAAMWGGIGQSIGTGLAGIYAARDNDDEKDRTGYP